VLEGQGARDAIAAHADADQGDAAGIDLRMAQHGVDDGGDHLFPIGAEVELALPEGIALSGAVEDEAVVAAGEGAEAAEDEHAGLDAVGAVVEDDEGPAAPGDVGAKEPGGERGAGVGDLGALGGGSRSAAAADQQAW
jgi:hypothetical protein